MLPSHLIRRLSPSAAKLYLTIAHLPHRPLNGKPSAPIRELCQLTRISRATCFRALAELRALHLVHILRRPQRQPATYILTQPAQPSSTNPQPSLKVSPLRPHTPATPIPASESLKVSPLRPQLTKPTLKVSPLASPLANPEQFLDELDQILADPELLTLFRKALGPETLAHIGTKAQTTLRRLDAAEAAAPRNAPQEPHP